MIGDEHKLIRQAQKGDAESFRRLYEEHVGPIYRFIFLKVSDTKEAEDITHDVFLSSWQNIRSYKHQGLPFSSWLYRIARNRVIDHYRTKKAHASIEDVDERLVGSYEHVESDAELALSIEKVIGLFDELSPDQRDVAILRFVEELSHREIAQILDKSEGAVRLIQHRALKNLRALLKERHDIEEV